MFRRSSTHERADRLEAAVALSESRRARYATGVSVVAVALALSGFGAAWHFADNVRVEAAVVRVDRATGAVEYVTRLDTVEAIGADQALADHFIGRYVACRLTFSRTARPGLANECALLSSEELLPQLRRWFAPSGEGSALDRYGQGGKADANIRLIHHDSPPEGFLVDGERRWTATVEAHRIEQMAGGDPSKPAESLLSIRMTWRYAPGLADTAARRINPLGFQVTEWRPTDITASKGVRP